MTTEITLLSQSHLPSIYFFSLVSSFSTSTPHEFLLLSTSLLFSRSILSSSCAAAVLLLCQYSSQFVLSLSFSVSLCPPPAFSQFCTSALLSFPLFLIFFSLSFSMPFDSHFPLSISSAASVDHLSKCQMATSATVDVLSAWYHRQRDRGRERVK